MKVCIVDDYKINVFVLKEFLTRVAEDKYDIVSFEDGTSCIEYVKNNPVDVILMDCNMPIMSGYDTTIEIKKINPNIRVIGVTANTFDEDLKKCYTSGMESVLTKPIFYEELISKIERKK